MKIKRKLQIGIIGSSGWEEYPGKKPDKKLYRIAFELGKLIAKNNSILVCGGKGGIMLEAARGAKKYKGITAGVISGKLRNKANKFIDVEIVSGIINCAEESIIISMCDGIISIGGGSGTLQELAIAYRNKKPVVCINRTGGWTDKVANSFLDDRKLIKFKSANNPDGAISILLKEIK
jgi:uncharacterized protein (TIGR00725 family)